MVFDGASLTYGELDRRSNRVAHHLRARGIESGSRVGISTERSLEMVVGSLGILKAGGAYVPLDPADPAERQDFLRRDGEISLVLDAELLRDPGIERESDQAVEAPTSATDEAYVMYTSGSTGEPKGVVVTHRNVVRLVTGQDYADFGPDEVFLQMAPLAFDASTFEIWGSAAARRAAGPLPGRIARRSPSWGHALERHGVTTLWLTAGLFHQIVDERRRCAAAVCGSSWPAATSCRAATGCRGRSRALPGVG